MPTEQKAASGIDAYSRNGLLIVKKGGTLPPRCIRCNSACDSPPTKITLIKRPAQNGALIGGLLGGAIGGALGGMVDNATTDGGMSANFEAYVCPTHRPNKSHTVRNILIILMLSAIAGLVGYYFFGRNIDIGFAIPCGVILLGVIIALGYADAVKKGAAFGLVLKGVESPFAVVKGAGNPFLESLPSMKMA